MSRPIIYGNSATPLNGKKVTDPDHTHRWTISVRGVNNEDISYFIKKVAFKLHDTYENPNRGELFEQAGAKRLAMSHENMEEEENTHSFGISLFPKTLLVIEKPPFEVSETGWGEFDVIIKLHFHPVSGEKPQTLYHHLKLHPYEEDGLGIKSKPVTSYLYDEIVSRKNTSWGSWMLLLRFQVVFTPRSLTSINFFFLCGTKLIGVQ